MADKFISTILFIALSIVSFTSCNSNKQDNSKNKNSQATEMDDKSSNDSTAFYEEILAKDSLNTDLRLTLATNYYAERKFDEAIYHLIIVCKIDDKNLEAFIMLGNVYYDTDQNENAIEFYEHALDLDNKNVNVRCDLATCYLKIKKPEVALDLLKKNLSIDKNHAQTHHNLSVVYKELGKFNEAEEELMIFNKLSK